MSEVYVLLTATGTRFAKLIQACTASPYTHASLALDAELNELYSFGRKQPTNPWSGGFIQESVYEGTYAQFPNTRCALLRLSLTPVQRDNILRILHVFRKNQDRYRYNLIGLLGVLLQFEIAPRHAYFCSQFVAKVLQQAGARLWHRPAGLITPYDFWQHPELRPVYEGLLFEYPRLERSRLQHSNSDQESSLTPRTSAS